MIENIESKNSKNNGIVKIKQNGIEYTVWTHANVVIKYIKDELKKRFPEKLIVKELNRIDLSIPEENLPVDIIETEIEDRKEQSGTDINAGYIIATRCRDDRLKAGMNTMKNGVSL